MKIFDGLATVVAFILEQIHNGLSSFLPDDSGWAWGLSIVFLTMTVRIVLFPLFVKQIKSQRRMQELAPKVKELQAKHKGDRETLNTELMKLYKDHGTNPISGCLPLILQLPIFFALFRVMNEVKPKGDGSFEGKFGLSDELIGQAAHAKVFGAPISAAFNSKASLLADLGNANATTVKVVAALMIVTMGATTFLTQRQMMARNGAPTDPQQAQVQKIMLYVLPLSFAVFGFSFPIGVLLYWLTTNVWSMGQQHYVIRRMPPVVPGAAAPVAKGKGTAPGRGKGKDAGKDAGKNRASSAAADPPAAPSAPQPTPSAGAARPAGKGGAKRVAGTRKNKQRKGGRR
ncbi:MAG TPA: membrane protein insertase YidC [Mycobacteriales bacterium]|nr:membrane protein insertase YidC [Mycobacteriales bacterium]